MARKQAGQGRHGDAARKLMNLVFMDRVRPEFSAILAGRRLELDAYLGELLPENQTFLWEIGCGHGHFLAAYAAAHRDKTCIGVDLAGERVSRALRKRDRLGLRNVHFVQAEARLFLEALPARPCLSEVFILFPDPWPKSRHHKNRIVQPTFLDALATRAAPDCRLFFRTDHQPYFEATGQTIERSAHWTLAADPWPFEHETVFQRRALSYNSLIARLKRTSS